MRSPECADRIDPQTAAAMRESALQAPGFWRGCAAAFANTVPRPFSFDAPGVTNDKQTTEPFTNQVNVHPKVISTALQVAKIIQ